jgi:hypothetical protein
LSTFELQIDPATLRVDIGMPVHSGFIPYPTAAALVETVKLCTARRLDVRQRAPIGSSILIDARSAVVDEFLNGNGTHLFWIDADMCWKPIDFIRLVSLCTEVDVVGATYARKMEPIRFMTRGRPRATPNPFGLLEIDGLGLGFCCMKREVVEKVAADKPMVIANGGKTPIREVFQFGRRPDGHRFGEDMMFFDDIKQAGYKIWLDPMVNVDHIGIKLYGGDVNKAIGREIEMVNE